jgi:hypothetical protein
MHRRYIDEYRCSDARMSSEFSTTDYVVFRLWSPYLDWTSNSKRHKFPTWAHPRILRSVLTHELIYSLLDGLKHLSSCTHTCQSSTPSSRII